MSFGWHIGFHSTTTKIINLNFAQMSIMQIVLVLHNLLRWAVLLFGLLTFVRAISGVISKRVFTAGDMNSNFWFMLSCDIQLLLGLILYFNGEFFDRVKNFHITMKDGYWRFFSFEHGVMMIVAWILVHVGRVSVKKASTSSSKHTRALIYFGLAILLILASIPWPFREVIARPLYRWFN